MRTLVRIGVELVIGAVAVYVSVAVFGSIEYGAGKSGVRYMDGHEVCW